MGNRSSFFTQGPRQQCCVKLVDGGAHASLHRCGELTEACHDKASSLAEEYAIHSKCETLREGIGLRSDTKNFVESRLTSFPHRRKSNDTLNSFISDLQSDGLRMPLRRASSSDSGFISATVTLDKSMENLTVMEETSVHFIKLHEAEIFSCTSMDVPSEWIAKFEDMSVDDTHRGFIIVSPQYPILICDNILRQSESHSVPFKAELDAFCLLATDEDSRVSILKSLMILQTYAKHRPSSDEMMAGLAVPQCRTWSKSSIGC
eukprot:gnl/MRDRNA2_/MRDRNA2_230524_c0_seq1.p1 gnl/MRDRNA2_/MRDRNA2_230524_c0~~gnl/MRDRNA2_/MRDRNA2_230524_c0_seq1.p1  ORF type:complete len:262 (-),score=14.26 gnl/MRDRNA2_/MRDRNA2_230524_c0_seq1:15-800(-)